jgi:transcriptional regulator with XRE-family HTH domain
MTKAREEKGWTKSKLSRVSGVPLTSVYSYETGMVLPGLLNLLSLADALGISLDEYVGRKSE